MIEDIKKTLKSLKGTLLLVAVNNEYLLDIVNKNKDLTEVYFLDRAKIFNGFSKNKKVKNNTVKIRTIKIPKKIYLFVLFLSFFSLILMNFTDISISIFSSEFPSIFVSF